MPLSREDWDYSTPLLGGLYPEPPYHYYEAKSMTVLYEMEDGVLDNLVPEPLEPVGNKCMVFMGGDCKVCTGYGSYLEAGIWPVVEFEGNVGCFECLLYLDNEIPICSGREIWGVEKKLARDMSLEEEQNIIRGDVHRGGNHLMSLSVSPMRPMQDEDFEELAFLEGGVYTVKLIPSAEKGQPPEVCQLVHIQNEIQEIHGFWKGKGSARFPDQSEVDPVYKFEPKNIIAGYYGILDSVLPHGEIVHEYDV